MKLTRAITHQFGKRCLSTILGLTLIFSGGAFPSTGYAAGTVTQVVVSQAGYSSADFKTATVLATSDLTDTTYQVLNGTTVVASGTMVDKGVVWNQHVYTIDFSGVQTTGTNFTVKSNAISSYAFPIQSNVWDNYKDEMTAFYRIQRAGVATADVYPTGYSSTAPSAKVFHDAGHLDDAKSADGTTHYDLVGGWYDAGDYGIYAGNQWVTAEIALAYVRNASAPNVRFDNDANGVPDLIDEARFGSEYLLKFANQLGGAIYDKKTNSGFKHPEKSTDNINNTSDDRVLANLGIGGSAKAAASLAATARAVNSALAGGYIDASKVAEFTTFAANCATAAVTFYNYANANLTGPQGSYATSNNGGLSNPLLLAEVEMYLLTGTASYKTSAASRVSTLTFSDIASTNYWDMRPMALNEFYPVADASTQTIIQGILKQQADYFLSSTDDTPYGVLDQFSNFGVNEPHVSFLGDMVRYYELFHDPAVLQAIQKGMYWVFGNNPWNISWVSGIGTDYVDYLHTRLDEDIYNHASTGVVIPGAMVSGPNMKDTKDKSSVSPWYQDRPLWSDDTNQWRYNEYSVSIQVGLLYSIMGLIQLNGSSSDNGNYPAAMPITSPTIGDYVTGNVTLFAQPTRQMSAVDLKSGTSYLPMTQSNGAYSTTVDVSTLAPYTIKRYDIRGTDTWGNTSFSSTHVTVAPPLPDPSHPLLYDNFGGGGTWGSSGLGWPNWYNQSGGTGTSALTTVDSRTVMQFTQTPSTSASQAKFEPWHDTIDLSGYRYVNVVMKNPGYAGSRIKINLNDGVSTYALSAGWVNVASTWTTYTFDINAFPALDKKKAHFEVWLNQTGGAYGEILIDDITALNTASGTAPTLTAVSLSPMTGDETTDYTFAVTYSDANNQKPFAVQVVVDGVIHNMTETDASDVSYTDGKLYNYTMKLPLGSHTYYIRTTDNFTDVVSTASQPGPTFTSTTNGYWKFDEASGTSTLDASGNGRIGTLVSGPTRGSGKVSGAIQLDGINDYVQVGWGQLSGNSARTMATWFKTSSSANATLLSWGTNASNQLSQLGVSSSTIGYLGSSNDLTTSLTGYADGNWHHVAVTFDGASMKLYLDGVLKNNKSTTLNSGVSDLNLGRSISGTGYFSGSLDQAMAVNRALTAAEVKSLANPTPLAQWSFNENTGTSAADASGNGYTGTLTNGPTWVNGMHNPALHFDGTDDYVTSAWGQITVNASRTLALWFRTKSVANGYMLSWGTNSGSALSQLAVSSGQIGFFGNGNNLVTQVYPYTDGKWHHVAVTFDGATMKLYLDGVLKGSRTTTLNTGSSAIQIGKAIFGSTNFSGDIDDVTVYNSALIDLDVQALMNRN
ncbi:glycoside hydrolase family 9 protein [Paenibacillus qinlingensis]|uniref:glycoside hydrolase family 9 protein n=1 Tax=Paenibacillus qinlingensis TaxID=1837343 RepID=UPI001563897D|nr:glycoside hydrolase family 9 protein [Paenibacillus qinlingensis]NQX58109.1 glycoside hydrolase family 9 protein [Paenibacillus qinlingensis]